MRRGLSCKQRTLFANSGDNYIVCSDSVTVVVDCYYISINSAVTIETNAFWCICKFSLEWHNGRLARGEVSKPSKGGHSYFFWHSNSSSSISASVLNLYCSVYLSGNYASIPVNKWIPLRGMCYRWLSVWKPPMSMMSVLMLLSYI